MIAQAAMAATAAIAMTMIVFMCVVVSSFLSCRYLKVPVYQIDSFAGYSFILGLYENVDGVDAIRICGQLAFSLEGTLLRKTISGTKPALDAEEKFPGMGGRGSLV